MRTPEPSQAILGFVFAVATVGFVVRSIRRADRSLLLVAAASLAVSLLTVVLPPFDGIVNQGTVVPEPMAVLQWIQAAGFFLLGAFTVTDWLRHGGRPRLALAGSIGLLGVLSLFGQAWLRASTSPQPVGPSLGLLLASGYLFFLFRHSLVPARQSTVAVVSSLAVLAVVVGVVVPLPGGRAGPARYSPLQSADLTLAVAVWAFCVGEPCLRLWMYSRTLPVVQRMRARSLTIGYGAIIAVLVVAATVVLAFQQMQGQPAFTYGLEILVMAALPLMYVSLVPPAWLRRFWRETEEERFRLATHSLLLGTPDPNALAAQCLEWAVRLVGAEAGCIVGLDGSMLATSNLTQEQALMLAGASHHSEGRQALRLSPDEGPSNVIIVPMVSATGQGAIAVVAGPFTPLLGSDEVDRLSQYAASVTAAFDRLQLLEQLSRARDAAERASVLKSEHLSRMSHELRTPMSAILGFADLLALNNPRPEQRRDIDAIIKAADHLLVLINQVLEIALIESGGGSLSMEPIDLAAVVNESVDLIGHRARAENVSIETQLHRDDAFILADGQRLRQVLVNLLSNAVKYNRASGRVTVTTEVRDGRIRLEVRDTGEGISSEALDRLFQPFERVGKENTAIEGTGLGLALSKALVEAMHGDIGVRSEPGVGSTFWVELTGAEAVSVASSDEDDATTALPRGDVRDILYVEDQLANVELATRILGQERPTLTLIPMSKGANALAYLADHRPGMILLDLHLGDMNGDDILRHIRSDTRLSSIPVVMLSADASAAQIERLTSLGATEYLTKPFRVKTFLRVIDEGLAGTLRSSRVPVPAASDPRR